ncbi:MAG: Rpn family recombination-promoting nuclease/putative transposase [Planctomycetaceae bacterium]|jgi:predicted transposase/invertase (TIGR01784 family)|nr:Rpn family recombination-promoting nuclease/putative transposase [Planctomycetaceae bacterium]
MIIPPPITPIIHVPIQFELEHPHDLLTRNFLFDVELFASLLEHYGDSGIVRLIDLKSLANQSPIIIDNNLQEVIGDLLFSAQFKSGIYSNIFLFFEHQSRKVRRFWLRCLRKLLEFYEIYDADPKNMIGKGGKYPYSIVVLLYHGQIRWEDLLQLRDMMELPSGMDPNVLWFPVILIDLSKIRRDKLTGHPALMALLDTLISYSEGKLVESFERVVSYFEQVKNDQRTYGWLKSLTRYFVALAKIGFETVTETISKIINEKETKEMVTSTMQELLQEGRKEGIKEGIKEGKIESKIQAVLKILKVRFKRIPVATENAIKSYKDPIALESLIEQAVICETLSEFERDLAHL